MMFLLPWLVWCLSSSSTATQTGGTGVYPATYNLIDPDPSCRYAPPSWPDSGPQCPIYNGPGDVDVMAIHPNLMERTEYLMRNMARLFPKYYASSAWGWSGTYASDCDESNSPTQPYYVMSEAIQAARLNAYSGATDHSGCSRQVCGSTSSHYTCCDYCTHNVWGECGFKYRTRAIVQLLFVKNAWNDVGSEGIWAGNTAFISSSSHCGQNFNPAYDHQGIGYYPGGATTMVGIKDTGDWEDHVFPHASHFDWNEADQFTFLVQWFGNKQTTARMAAEVYLLYDGAAELLQSPIVGNESSGFYLKELPLRADCEPYAFIAKDQLGEWHRLPEDDFYYFGTVSHTDSLVAGTASCDENHYYFTGTEWSANGGPGLSNSRTAGTNCVGCPKVSSLHDIWLQKPDGVAGGGGENSTNSPSSGPTSTRASTSLSEGTLSGCGRCLLMVPLLCALWQVIL